MPAIDIGTLLGVPAQLEPNGTIHVLVPVGDVLARSLEDIVAAGVLHAPNAIVADALCTTVTYIYRLINDREVLKAQGLPASESTRGLKFDVTCILPDHENLWKGEFPKTIGHYHTPLYGSSLPSPDFYQVVHGNGIVMLQSNNRGTIQSFGVAVGTGDVLLIPPDLAHVTINTGRQALVFANICVRRPHLDYESVTKYGGAAFYVLRSYGYRPTLVQNPSYALNGLKVKPLEWVRPNYDELGHLGVLRDEPIYDCLERESKVLRALLAPDQFATVFRSVLIPDNLQDQRPTA